MIIQCKSCSKRFIVKDSDIPEEGRLVQCGYCSTKWHQRPNQILQNNPAPELIKNIPPSKKSTKNVTSSNIFDRFKHVLYLLIYKIKYILILREIIKPIILKSFNNSNKR